jgi:MYXO-CTERM domain-containing protein
VLGLAGGCVQDIDLGSESQEIVGGTTTSDYPAVAQISMEIVGASETTYASCSSTLISPRVLLTAAHCIDSEDGTTQAVSAYFGTRAGNDSGFIQSIPAVDWTFADPWSLSGNDIALVLLEYDSDVEPMAYNTQVMTSGDIGRSLHVVGWGNTSVGVGSGTKRHMTTPITGFQSNLVLNYGDAGSNTCQGDSGGPGFISTGGVERVAGITSFGTNGCSGYSGSTRVAQYNNYISNYIAANDIPQPPEVTIVAPLDNAEVSSGFPVNVEATDNTRVEKIEIYLNGNLVGEPPVNIPPYIISTPVIPDGAAVVEVRAYDNRGDVTSKSVSVVIDSTCDGPEDCSGVQLCSDAGMCVAPDYDLGSACLESGECDSGICATVAEESLCTSNCTPGDNATCPADFACLRASEELGYCWPDDGSSESGGCSTTGGSGGLLGGLFLLLALTWRRRE